MVKFPKSIYRLQRVCFLLVLVGLLASLPGCGERDVETRLASLQSPSHQLVVELVRVVHEGWSVPEASVIDEVRVVGLHDAKSAILVFSMETDGSDKERPDMAWVGEDILQVYIPRGVVVGYWATQMSALRVNVIVK